MKCFIIYTGNDSDLEVGLMKVFVNPDISKDDARDYLRHRDRLSTTGNVVFGIVFILMMEFICLVGRLGLGTMIVMGLTQSPALRTSSSCDVP